MKFEHTEDRRMLADSLNRLLSTRRPPGTHAPNDHGIDEHNRQIWESLNSLGVVSALFDEQYGGYGGHGFDIAVVFECLGRGLVSGPLLGTLLFGKAIEFAASEAQKHKHLPGLIEGTTIAAAALDEAGAHYDLATVRTTATAVPAGWILNGHKAVVPYAEFADVLLVSARTSGSDHDTDGISLFIVPADVANLHRISYSNIDASRASDIRFSNVALGPESLIGQPGEGIGILEHAVGYGILALSAEAVGAMEFVKEQTLDYLRTRKQFGVPIGSFQALQHRMADVLLEIEQARSAVINAAAAVKDEGPRRERALSAAKLTVGRTGTFVAEESIQLHGGIGMTWELAMSHYAKRLVMIDHQLGDEDHHLRRYIAFEGRV
ncbi:acyl-CoA dehydrogenase family protein [Paraburkholderia fungorum]|uniref:acyl-CoA dehydrogenase family protein n=1 Tax=Paraburkholderia fungorum TaxID=134537 RepID=UPI0038BD042A